MQNTFLFCPCRVITIEEKSYPILEAYLKYLYTDKLEVDLELAVGKEFSFLSQYSEFNILSI